MEGKISNKKLRIGLGFIPVLALAAVFLLLQSFRAAAAHSLKNNATAFEPVNHSLAAAASDPLVSEWLSAEDDASNSAAWGDVDGDGDLDLAVGNGLYPQKTRVYYNENGSLEASASWQSAEIQNTYSVAWGDVDSDGDLDLAVGNSCRVYDPYDCFASHLYRNDHGVLSSAAAYTLTNSASSNIRSLAWGDLDGDGDLDLAVGNWAQANRIYRNDSAGGVITMTLAWTAAQVNNTRSIALGDADGDGKLDLAVGNLGEVNRIYRNTGSPGAIAMTLAWSSTETDATTSLAWGDVNGDGKLDLACGNGAYDTDARYTYLGERNRLYLNQSSVGSIALASTWLSNENEDTTDVDFGDYDSDGDLDLLVVNYNVWYNGIGSGPGAPVRLYRNDGGALTASAAWTSYEYSYARSAAWADVDNDGDLDAVVANGRYGQSNRLYRNDSGVLRSQVQTLIGLGKVNNVALGDYDGDGDLDLALAYDSGSPSYRPRIYENQNGVFTSKWVGPGTAPAILQLAWGDVDGDGDLDLGAAYGGRQENIFRNDSAGGTVTMTMAWTGTVMDNSQALAWGDYDGDGDLDMAIGNGNTAGVNYLYRNDSLGSVISMTRVWTSTENESTWSVAWGDYDGDGDLDLAAGNCGFNNYNRVYRNDNGSLLPSAVWSAPEDECTNSIAWGDTDGDGDLDLLAANASQINRLYRNDNGVLSLTPEWSSLENDSSTQVGLVDYDQDGDLDQFTSNYGVNRLHTNLGGVFLPRATWASSDDEITEQLTYGDIDNDGDIDFLVTSWTYGVLLYRNRNETRQLRGSNPLIRIIQPEPGAENLHSAHIWDAQVIPISYTLSEPNSQPVQYVRAWYSPNGGGTWLPAVASSDTFTSNLATSPTGTQHVFKWDVYASHLLGQSDNVIFRIQAAPALAARPDQAAGPYLYGSTASHTFPFRVRGMQVRVMYQGQPAAGAMVYHQPGASNGAYQAFRDLTGAPYRTTSLGWLQGYGQMALGDRLAALMPAGGGDGYDLYYTSAAVTEDGLEPHAINSGGVQTLTVTSTQPLALFNLELSLQWDARYDPNALAQIESDLERTSQLLYDWSNGQAALGRIRVYHDRENWETAHIRIYVSESQRPMALQGGIVSEVISDTQHSSIAYAPGQVHMGAAWNRYGDSGTSLGDDWPRALAHELGHYALFLNDNYLGLDAQRRVIPVETCSGAMADPYREDYPYDEFHPAAGWLPGCEDTLSNQTTGRADWETIAEFYPALDGTALITGPAALPLAVTEIQWFEPVTPTAALVDPTFYLVEAGGRVEPRASTRAFLFQDGWALDLGKPRRDRVLARGARVGDEVCVYEPKEQRLGCETVKAGDEFIEMERFSGWQPEIIVTPVNTVTIQVEVKGVTAGLGLRAALYPLGGPAVAELPLVEGGGAYSGTFSALAEAVLEGYVRIWVDEDKPRRESITDFAVGSNPVRLRGNGVRLRGNGVRLRGNGAPVMSADGQVILYVDETQLAADEFYTLQAATAQPQPLPWATLVGLAYQLAASQPDMDLSKASISFSYLGDEAPPGEEAWLRVYYRGPLSTTWGILPTRLDLYHNTASAPAQGVGLYALMSSLEIPLPDLGWNLFAYPVNATRAVTEALQSIEGDYGILYGYDGSDTLDPWKGFNPSVPGWANNDLHYLEFGHGYWISVTHPITLYLKGASLRPEGIGGYPPATFYGTLQPFYGWTPAPDMLVTAAIDGKQCGQARTKLVEGLVRFVIDVLADGWGSAAGCGAPGETITFYVDGRQMWQTAVWDNNHWWETLLLPTNWLYMPVLRR